MLRQKVYIETTVISYLTGRVSSSLSVASHQQTTQRWWDLHRASYDLFISPLVVDEIRAGDPVAAAAREQAIAGIAVLATTRMPFGWRNCSSQKARCQRRPATTHSMLPWRRCTVLTTS